MRYVASAAAFAIAAYVLHRIGLWAERRGWIYYRTSGSVSLGDAMVEAQALVEPSKRHLRQTANTRVAGAESDGPPFSPADVELIPLPRDEWEELAGDPRRFGDRRNLRLASDPALLAQIGKGTVSFLDRIGASAPWTSYLAVSRRDGTMLGTCSFKSHPVDGIVEIAYFTFPPFEGRGVGTAMAAGLVKIALESGAVARVRAHTLPGPNGSTRILQKNGFHRVGELIDPDDGLVWRWERG